MVSPGPCYGETLLGSVSDDFDIYADIQHCYHRADKPSGWDGTLIPLIILGLASVIYWRFCGGDQRFYGLVQFYPMLAIPLILILFPPRYSRAGYFWGVIGWYGIAKLCELFDGSIYGWTRFISGHSIKHLFAALAVWWILLMLRGRGKGKNELPMSNDKAEVEGIFGIFAFFCGKKGLWRMMRLLRRGVYPAI